MIERPQEISLSPGVRLKSFGCTNYMLRFFYNICRVIFVSLWFYYLPMWFVVYANLQPIRTYQATYEECASYKFQSCVGAEGDLCVAICEAEMNQLSQLSIG